MIGVVLYFTNTPSHNRSSQPQRPEETTMNVRTFEARRNDAAKSAPAAQPAPVRHQHRERDFGVGYGNSSGYASNRRYSSNAFQPLFRCA